ncbi:MAG: hypothetical protein SVK54_03580 [candidate division WOR-3 bacterium]|nr:hypothetical protein [candidate division WOR-3 bacterium]
MGRLILLCLIVLLALQSCYIDMPHNSKMDPLNPFGEGQLVFHVYNKRGGGIENALISIGSDTLLTDSSGFAGPYEAIKGSLSIMVSKGHYTAVCIDTVIETGDSMYVNRTLNFKPSIMDYQVTTSIVKTMSLTDSMDRFITVNALIMEDDGSEDIARSDASLSLTDMHVDCVSDSAGMLHYSGSIEEDTLSFNIFDLTGSIASLYIEDSDGEWDSLSDRTVSRFVQNIIEIVRPETGTDFNPPDTVKWLLDEPDYSTCISLIIEDRDCEVVFRCDSLSSSKRQFAIDSLFTSGRYLLKMRLYDIYGNYSQNSTIFTVK